MDSVDKLSGIGFQPIVFGTIFALAGSVSLLSCFSDSDPMAAAKRSGKAKTPVTKITDRRALKGKIKPSDLKNLKKLGHIASLLERLHKIGAARDKAGNRSLHMDQCGLLVLMWIFNPVIDSMGLDATRCEACSKPVNLT